MLKEHMQLIKNVVPNFESWLLGLSFGEKRKRNRNGHARYEDVELIMLLNLF